MEQIVIICNSEDKILVERLSRLLKNITSTWWYKDKRHGNWEEVVTEKIKRCKVVIAFLSSHFHGEQQDILRDEMALAKKSGKDLILFCQNKVDIPLGFDRMDRIDEANWNGEESHTVYQELKEKLLSLLCISVESFNNEINLQKKIFIVPEFVYSLSSHETQLSPHDGLILREILDPKSILISAYDIHTIIHGKIKSAKKKFLSLLKNTEKSKTIIFLDSGNYEAKRKNDYFSEKNENGWSQEKFWEIALLVNPDITFSYDNYKVTADIKRLKRTIINSYYKDVQAIQGKIYPICPIIHIPQKQNILSGALIAELIRDIAVETNPIFLAIPERELGEGIIARYNNIKCIRKTLNDTGKYYPLHLLGAGNPISLAFFAAAGADSFDGLEWCRTIMNYGVGTLFHFQHLDFFDSVRLNRIKNTKLKQIVANKSMGYNLRALSYNFDAFNDWFETIKTYIQHGNSKELLKMAVSYVGQEISIDSLGIN